MTVRRALVFVMRRAGSNFRDASFGRPCTKKPRVAWRFHTVFRLKSQQILSAGSQDSPAGRC